MATKKTTEHVDAYYIRTKGMEIGPFRSRAAAVEEAKAIRASDPDVKIQTRAVTRDAFDAPVAKRKAKSSTSKKTGGDDDLFDDDDGEDEEDDDDLDDLFDDDEEDDDDEEEEEDDDPPAVTHPFFKPIGKGKT